VPARTPSTVVGAALVAAPSRTDISSVSSSSPHSSSTPPLPAGEGRGEGRLSTCHPDPERSEGEGSLYETENGLMSEAALKGIPRRFSPRDDTRGATPPSPSPSPPDGGRGDEKDAASAPVALRSLARDMIRAAEKAGLPARVGVAAS